MESWDENSLPTKPRSAGLPHQMEAFLRPLDLSHIYPSGEKAHRKCLGKGGWAKPLVYRVGADQQETNEDGAALSMFQCGKSHPINSQSAGL